VPVGDPPEAAEPTSDGGDGPQLPSAELVEDPMDRAAHSGAGHAPEVGGTVVVAATVMGTTVVVGNTVMVRATIVGGATLLGATVPVGATVLVAATVVSGTTRSAASGGPSGEVAAVCVAGLPVTIGPKLLGWSASALEGGVARSTLSRQAGLGSSQQTDH
jgi:hypothetical protein